MKFIRKRGVALLMVVLLALGVFAPMTTQAASSKVSIEPEVLWAGCEYYSGARLNNFPDNMQVLSVKSSNPNVIKAEYQGKKYYEHILIPLKAGKSRITITYKIGGKTGSVSAIYTVKKYPNPYVSITAGGTKINLKDNKYYFDYNNYKKPTASVVLKLKNGWKITDSYGFTGISGKDSKDISVTNGKAFKVPAGKGSYTNVFFNVENKKHESIQYGVRFYR